MFTFLFFRSIIQPCLSGLPVKQLGPALPCPEQPPSARPEPPLRRGPFQALESTDTVPSQRDHTEEGLSHSLDRLHSQELAGKSRFQANCNSYVCVLFLGLS